MSLALVIRQSEGPTKSYLIIFLWKEFNHEIDCQDKYNAKKVLLTRMKKKKKNIKRSHTKNESKTDCWLFQVCTDNPREAD